MGGGDLYTCPEAPLRRPQPLARGEGEKHQPSSQASPLCAFLRIQSALPVAHSNSPVISTLVTWRIYNHGPCSHCCRCWLALEADSRA